MGHRQMTGAMVLACKAALRSGAGLVNTLVPEACRDAMVHQNPEAMCVDVPGEYLGREAISIFDQHLKGITSVMIGPGM